MFRKFSLVLCAVNSLVSAETPSFDTSQVAYLGVKGGQKATPYTNVVVEELEVEDIEIEYSASASASYSASPSASASASASGHVDPGHVDPPAGRCGFDNDGDGVTNDQELIDGTNPNDIDSFYVPSVDITCVSKEWIRGDADMDCFSNFQEWVANTMLFDSCSNELFLDLTKPDNESPYGYAPRNNNITTMFYVEADPAYRDILDLAGIAEDDTLLTMVFRYNTINKNVYELTAQTNVVCGVTTCGDTENFTAPEGLSDMTAATIINNPGTIDGEQLSLFYIIDEALDVEPTDFRTYADVYIKNLNFVADRNDMGNVPSILESSSTKIVNLYMEQVIIQDWVTRLTNEQISNSISQTDLSVISLKNVNFLEISRSAFIECGRVFSIMEMSNQQLLDKNEQVIDSPPMVVVENTRFEKNGFINVVTKESVIGDGDTSSWPGDTSSNIIPVEKGACIYIDNIRNAQISLFNSYVTQNYAKKGGFIYVEQSEPLSDFVIENSNVQNNFAYQGSFAYFASPPDKTLFGPSYFYNNGKLSSMTIEGNNDLLLAYGMSHIFDASTSEGSIIYIKDNVDLSKDIIIRMGDEPLFSLNLANSYAIYDKVNTVLRDNCETIVIGLGYDLSYTHSANLTVDDSYPDVCQQNIMQTGNELSLK